MSEATTRKIDFICPFVEGHFRCPEIISPIRQVPSNRERKLFVLSGRPEAPTKNACPHCSVFIKEWRKNTGLLGHLKYGWIWLFNKEIREPRSQESL